MGLGMQQLSNWHSTAPYIQFNDLDTCSGQDLQMILVSVRFRKPLATTRTNPKTTNHSKHHMQAPKACSVLVTCH